MKVMKRKNNKIRWSDESGMTLVEVLVAIALISMIVTTFLSFFIQAAKTLNCNIKCIKNFKNLYRQRITQ